MPDSSTGGYLRPKASPALAPTEDEAFEDFVQGLLVGLTGFDADTGVRPAWQPEPPPVPEPSVDWVAFAVSQIPTDLEADEEQTEAGGMIQTKHELLELRVSAYGPHAQGTLAQIRDGLDVAQNREPLYTAGVGLIRVGRMIHAPERKGGRWYNRWDLSLVLSRESRREYAQLHFLGAAGVVESDQGENPPGAEVVVQVED